VDQADRWLGCGGEPGDAHYRELTAAPFLNIAFAPQALCTLLPARMRHVENEPCHLRGLILLDEVSSARHKKQLGLREDFMEASGDASIQVRIGVAKNDPDRPSELSKPGEHFCA
jgi:hypothetical protein